MLTIFVKVISMNYFDKVQDFSPETVNALQKFIEKKRQTPALKEEFVNRILREDIFDLLSRECTVIYFPLDGEENDGFHVQMPVNGEKQHFVYINTAKPLPKQIYAAAHELGHIWTDNGKILYDALNSPEQADAPGSPDEADALMNRFAAELLMPEDVFAPLASKKLDELKSEPGKISEENFFRAVAYLMDEYFVPFQAVVRRLYEVRIISRATCREIEEKGYKESADGKKMLEDCINEGGYSKLSASPNRKKSMTGFTELLDQAEANGIFRPEKVEYLRRELNLPKVGDSKNTIEIGQV